MRRVLGAAALLIAGVSTTPALAQSQSGYVSAYPPFVFDKAAAAATTPSSTILATRPANSATTPTSAVPQTKPEVRPSVAASNVGAFILPVIEPILETTGRLLRGSLIKDATGLASGAVVSAGSQLAIIMVGPHRIQVPANSIGGTAGTLAVSMTPDQVANLLAVSSKFQAETAKLRKPLAD